MLRYSNALLALVAAVGIVAATHAVERDCEPAGSLPALGLVEITDGAAENSYYIDDRGYVDGNGIWIYEETNGVWVPKAAGLHSGDATRHSIQRGGCSGPLAYCGDLVPDDSDICWDEGPWVPDIRIF